MNGQQMLKRDFVGDLTPREGRLRRATTLAARQAAKNPVTLATLGAASLIALACQLVAPLVAVPVIFGVLFLVRLRNGRTWTTAERTARESPIELPDLIWYSDVGAQAAIRRLGQARRALAAAVAHSPQDPEHEILARLRSVAEIERRIVLLAVAGRVSRAGSWPRSRCPRSRRRRSAYAPRRRTRPPAKLERATSSASRNARPSSGMRAPWRGGATSCWPQLTTCWRPWRCCRSS